MNGNSTNMPRQIHMMTRKAKREGSRFSMDTFPEEVVVPDFTKGRPPLK
jgi:hypothetical protein